MESLRLKKKDQRHWLTWKQGHLWNFSFILSNLLQYHQVELISSSYSAYWEEHGFKDFKFTFSFEWTVWETVPLKGLGITRRNWRQTSLLSLFSLPLERKGFTSQPPNSCCPALAIKREIKLNYHYQSTSPGEVKVWEWWHWEDCLKGTRLQ